MFIITALKNFVLSDLGKYIGLALTAAGSAILAARDTAKAGEFRRETGLFKKKPN